MSGVATGRTPRREAEWVRDVEHRLRLLENPTAARIGEWVLNSVDGELVATKPGDAVTLSGGFVELPDLTSQLRGYVSQGTLADIIAGPSPSPQLNPWQRIESWVATLPSIGSLAGVLAGVVDGTLADIGEWVAGLPALVDGLLSPDWIPSLSSVWTGTISGARLLAEGFITNLTNTGMLSLNALISGTLPLGVKSTIAQITNLTGYLSRLDPTGVLNGIWSVTGLSGYLSNLTPQGLLALTGLAPGSLPPFVSSTIGQIVNLRGYLTNLTPQGLLNGVGAVVGLGGYLANMTTTGILSLAGLANGTLPLNISINAASLTGALNTALTVGSQTLAGLQADASAAVGQLSTILATTGQTTATAFAQFVNGLVPVQSILDALGSTAAGLAGLTSALQNFPAANISSVLGAGANLGEDIEAFLVGSYATLTGAVTGTIEDWKQQLGYFARTFLGYNAADPSSPVANSFVDTTFASLGRQAVAQPTFLSLDPSGNPCFPLANFLGVSPLPTLPITEGSARGCLIGIPADNAEKHAVSFLGYPEGGDFADISEFHVTVYAVNLDTGEFDQVVTDDILADMAGGTAVDWNFFNFDPADYPKCQVKSGDWFAVLFELVGAGTFHILGLSHLIPDHPTSHPKGWGFTRVNAVGDNAPATIAAPVYADAVPWASLTGKAGTPDYPPMLTRFDEVGTGFIYHMPSWANTFDIAVFGAGGGSVAGAVFAPGFGGGAGQAYGITLKRGPGEAIPSTTETMVIDIGGGGGPAGPGGSAGSGGGSFVTITGYGALTTYGGTGGVGNFAGVYGGYGAGAANIVLNDETFFGGPTQGASGFPGNPPGGGAAGGNAGYVGSWTNGNWGAPGRVYIVARRT